MRWSRSFLPTLRDDPADAEAVSHKLMVRAGLIRQLGAGIYSWLPLGKRVMRKVEAIVREEMEGIGAQEFFLPALLPAEPFRQSGRWENAEVMEIMFRLRDRRHADMCLGFTHEEIFTSIARDALRSYRELPTIWYQIQTKFRDEPRPKSGVLRGRQFVMKDSYSFDLDEAGLDRSFELHADAYKRIFSRCGLETLAVEASSGAMGGSESVEFMSFSDAGEDFVVTCEGCGYAANLEKAVSVAEPFEEAETGPVPEKFATPGVTTIEQLAEFGSGTPASCQIKTLVYAVAGEPSLFLVRGDHELNEVKAIEAVGTADFRPGHPDEIRQAMGASAGSLGGVGVTHLPIWADECLRGRTGMTTGANEDGFHLRKVDVERDIPSPRWADLRRVAEGEACAHCGKPLSLTRSIEVGHIFKLGLRYSKVMGATVLDADGAEVPITMGCYGIGVDRIVAAAIESHHDEDGIRWPLSIAPFEVAVVPVKASDPEQARVADELYEDLQRAGVDVILDDRDERAGVKFKDSDLIGFPLRLVLGPRALKNGNVELFERASGETREVAVGSAVSEVLAALGRREAEACSR